MRAREWLPLRPAALASGPATWQERGMRDKPTPSAGGALIAFGAMVGAGGGFAFGEATRGLLIGTALGVVAAILIWRRDARS